MKEKILRIKKRLAGARNFLSADKSRLFTVAVIILVGTASFGLGRLSAIESSRKPLEVSYEDPAKFAANFAGGGETSGADSSASVSLTDSQASKNSGEVVASKSGKFYHYPWCSGALRISKSNLVTFKSTEEARQKGYLPASNCKGLK